MNREFDTAFRYIKLKDLLFVILYGAVLSLLFGVLIGFIDYYLQNTIKISFSGIFFFLSSMQVGKLVRKQYDYPHIVYIVITGVFLLLQAIIIYFLPFIYQIVIEFNAPEAVFDLSLYLAVLKSFVSGLFSAFNINQWLYVLIFGIGTYLGVKQTY